MSNAQIPAHLALTNVLKEPQILVLLNSNASKGNQDATYWKHNLYHPERTTSVLWLRVHWNNRK